MKAKKIRYTLLLTMLLLASCCSRNSTDKCNVKPIPRKVNPDLVKLTEFGHFHSGLWINDSTVCASGFYFVLDEEFNIIKRVRHDGWGIPIAISPTKSRVLFISKNESDYYNALANTLQEFDLKTGTVTELKQNIFAALYYKSEDSLILCSQDKKFYLYNRLTQEETLLSTSLSSDLYDVYIEKGYGNSFRASGFDVHPVQNKLLIPTANKIVEYDMDSKKTDTLNVELLAANSWVRYNKNGSRIVYSSLADNKNEVGIVDRLSGKKTVLDCNTSDNANNYCLNMCPTWSLDGKHIIFGSTEIANYCEGTASNPQLYVLSVNE